MHTQTHAQTRVCTYSHTLLWDWWAVNALRRGRSSWSLLVKDSSLCKAPYLLYQLMFALLGFSKPVVQRSQPSPVRSASWDMMGRKGSTLMHPSLSAKDAHLKWDGLVVLLWCNRAANACTALHCWCKDIPLYIKKQTLTQVHQKGKPGENPNVAHGAMVCYIAPWVHFVLVRKIDLRSSVLVFCTWVK